MNDDSVHDHTGQTKRIEARETSRLDGAESGQKVRGIFKAPKARVQITEKPATLDLHDPGEDPAQLTLHTTFKKKWNKKHSFRWTVDDDRVARLCDPTNKKTVTVEAVQGGSTDIHVEYTLGKSTANDTTRLTVRAPQLDVAAEPIDFGEVVVRGKRAKKTLTVENKGSLALNLREVSASGAIAADLTVEPTQATIDPNGSVTLTLRYKPKSAGEKSGRLTLRSNDPTSPKLRIELKAKATAPKIRLSKAAVDFGGSRTDESKSEQIQVHNDGDAPLDVELPVSGHEAFSAAQGPGYKNPIGPGESSDLKLSFSPKKAEAVAYELEIKSNDKPRSPLKLPLKGSGIKPVLEVDKAELKFDKVLVGTPKTETLTLKNAGNGNLKLTVGAPGKEDFAFNKKDPFPNELAPGKTAQLDVVFTPKAEGAVADVLKLTTDEPGRTEVTIAVSGTGAQPVIALAAESVDFGKDIIGEKVEKTLRVENTGGAALKLETIAVTSPFSCEQTEAEIAAGQSLELKLAYTADKAEKQTAELTCTSNDPQKKQVKVSLQGEGQTCKLTPKLVCAATEAWLDPALPSDQDDDWRKPEDKKSAPVELTVSLTREPDHPYPGKGTLKRASAALSVFYDKECTQPVFSGGNEAELANDKLVAQGGTKLWAKGTKDEQPGKVKLSLSLEDKGAAFELGAPAEKELEVKKVNVLVPVFELEYKVVPLDKKLTQHQTGTKTPVPPVVCEVGLTVTQGAPDYTKKVFLKPSATKLSIYTDEGCTTELGGQLELPLNEVTGGKKKKLYLRGKTAGKLELDLELEGSAPEFRLAKKKAKVEVGVVELAMELHSWSDAEPPVLTALSDTDQVKKGRVLHLQDQKHFGRAKLVIKKLNAAHWPAGCDTYKIVLQKTQANGDVEVYDAETDGTKQPAKLELAQSALASAEKVLWVEGTGVSKAKLDATLDLGLDRGAGGPAKKEKRYADLACFTVVKIAKVAPKDQFDAPSNDYNQDKHRVYINLPPNKRKLKIKAALSEPLDGIKLHFMLAPDKDNGKAANHGIDIPNTWNAIGAALKHKDKADAAHELHYAVVTSGGGKAEKELKLSQFGGDIFKAGVYTHQDPHLAKFVDGDATHGTRKPVLSKKIHVWRKLWYQLTHKQGFNPPDPDASRDAYEKVKVEFVAAPAVRFQEGTAPAGTFYEKWKVVKGNNSNTKVAVIGDHNSNHYYGLRQDDPSRPMLSNLVVTELQFDYQDTSYNDVVTSLKTFTVKKSPSRELEMDEKVFIPPLKNALKVRGQYKWGGSWHSIPTANIKLKKPRTSLKKVTVTLPNSAPSLTQAGASVVGTGWADGAGRTFKWKFNNSATQTVTGTTGPTLDDYVTDLNNDGSFSANLTASNDGGKLRITATGTGTSKGFEIRSGTINAQAGLVTNSKHASRIKVRLKLRGCSGPFCGENNGRNNLIVYEGDDADYKDTIVHEVGHSMNQTPKPGNQPATIPNHPNQFTSAGSHCNFGNKKCVMYKSGPQATAIHEYCEKCHPYLIVEDMTTFRG